MNTKTWILTLAGLAAAATLAAAQGRTHVQGGERAAGDASVRGEHDGERFAGRGGRAGARHGRFAGRMERARRFVRELELTDAQRALARQEAQALAPTARAAREEARAIVEKARAAGRTDAARAEARASLGALRDRLRSDVAPHGRALVDSLTPEQRARIEARLAARGRTFDAQRASERVGRWLLRPRVQERARELPSTR